MKVLITGANGFVGKNLIAALTEQEGLEILSYDIKTGKDLLSDYCKVCDFVYHLAGVNRTENKEDYYTGNVGFTQNLIEYLAAGKNSCPILYTSSIHAVLDNPYGRSKKACEELLHEYGENNQVKSFIYRLPNLFGRWCKPNYNSVIATFCYNISNGLPIHISDPDITINFAYIDDLVKEFISALTGRGYRGSDLFYTIPITHKVSLGQIAQLLYAFKEGYKPENIDTFESKLYCTYLSY